MSVSRRAANDKQRKRIAVMSMKDLMESKTNSERNPLFTGNQTCHSCGFKARYQFVRCPECNKVQE